MTNIDYDSVNREVAHYERRRDEIIVIEVLYDEVMTDAQHVFAFA